MNSVAMSGCGLAKPQSNATEAGGSNINGLGGTVLQTLLQSGVDSSVKENPNSLKIRNASMRNLNQ